jgi:hypothetical protein
MRLAISPRSRSHLLNGHAGEVGVEVIGRLHQLALGVIDVGEQDAVLHIATRGDDDDQQTPVREPQKLDVPKHGGAPRGHHHPHKVGQIGE